MHPLTGLDAWVYLLGQLMAVAAAVLAALRANAAKAEASKAASVCGVAVEKLAAQDVKTIASDVKIATIGDNTNGRLSRLTDELAASRLENIAIRNQLDSLREFITAHDRWEQEARNARRATDYTQPPPLVVQPPIRTASEETEVRDQMNRIEANQLGQKLTS